MPVEDLQAVTSELFEQVNLFAFLELVGDLAAVRIDRSVYFRSMPSILKA